MNIYARRGFQVTVTEASSQHGNDSDRDLVKKYLKIGEKYKVSKTRVYRYHVEVTLKEFPGIVFDSGSFEDASVQSQEDDKKHPDWYLHNK